MLKSVPPKTNHYVFPIPKPKADSKPNQSPTQVPFFKLKNHFTVPSTVHVFNHLAPYLIYTQVPIRTLNSKPNQSINIFNQCCLPKLDQDPDQSCHTSILCSITPIKSQSICYSNTVQSHPKSKANQKPKSISYSVLYK